MNDGKLSPASSRYRSLASPDQRIAIESARAKHRNAHRRAYKRQVVRRLNGEHLRIRQTIPLIPPIHLACVPMHCALVERSHPKVGRVTCQGRYA